MIVNDSPDIAILDVKVQLNISGNTPVINLTNLSVPLETSPAVDLDGLVWALNIFSPTGTPIYQSNFDSPFQTGVWSTVLINNQFPRPFNQIEWSGADYVIKFDVKDINNKVYSFNKNVQLIRPVGNTKKSSNTFGKATLQVTQMCDRASLYIQDSTSKIYNGIIGQNLSSYLAVDYPRDSTGVLPAPFTITSFTGDALVPFSFNANGYKATYYAIYEYDLGENISVVIRYTSAVEFDVTCDVDLCPLAYEVKKLEYSIENGTCENVIEAKNKLNLITPKLLRAFIAKTQPACGENLYELIEEIKKIGGFQCECINGSDGIGQQSTLIEGVLFQINSEGGDIGGYFSVTNNNVVLNLKDKSYTFRSESLSATLNPVTTGSNVVTTLKINNDLLAGEMLNAISLNANWINLLNSLITSGSSPSLIVDGKCIFDSNPSCNYTFTLSDIPNNTTFALLVSINAPAFKNLNFSFNLTNLSALQTYLNGLGIGVFSVLDIGGGQVAISTNNNSVGLSELMYNSSTGQNLATLNKICTGYSPLSINEVIQNVINYICALNDRQVYTSEDYVIYYTDESGLKKSATVESGEQLNTLIEELLERGEDLVDYVLSLKTLSCLQLQNTFSTYIQPLQSGDYLFGSKGGQCAKILPVELGTRILQLGIYNTEFMAAFCNAAALCVGGSVCDAYNRFDVDVVENSPLDNNVDLYINFSQPNAVSHTVRYARIDNTSTPVFITSTGLTTSPYIVQNVPEGQYLVYIKPVYANENMTCPEVAFTTPACVGIYSFSAINGNDGNIIVSYTADNSLQKIQVNINYPNGGFSSTQYLNNGSDISVPIPNGLTGDFSVSISPVCNVDTGFIGAPTSAVVVTVNPPNNSGITNNTPNSINNLSVRYRNGVGQFLTAYSTNVFASGDSQSLYVPDGNYNFRVNMTVLEGYTAILSTNSGVYNGVVRSYGFEFTNSGSDISVSGGVEISINYND